MCAFSPLLLCQRIQVQSLHAIPADGVHALPNVISVGKGYRSLINRFTDSNQSCETSPTNKLNNHLHCIIWRAEHWTPL